MLLDQELEEKIKYMEEFAQHLAIKAIDEGLSKEDKKAVDNILLMVPFCYDEEGITEEQRYRLVTISKRLFHLSSYSETTENGLIND